MLADNKQKTVCFSGHRLIEREREAGVVSALSGIIDLKLKEGYAFYISGGAVGFDTAAALCVIKAKRNYPGIKLILAIPHREYHTNWSGKDAAMFGYIIERADEVIYVTERYDSGCMHRRNRFMVDHAGLLIAYCNGTKGGTVYTYNYAVKCGIDRINLYQEPLRR